MTPAERAGALLREIVSMVGHPIVGPAGWTFEAEKRIAEIFLIVATEAKQEDNMARPDGYEEGFCGECGQPTLMRNGERTFAMNNFVISD